MVYQSLKNKKVIISAGGSGIGWATAKIFLARGAYVYLCDIDSKSLNRLNKHPLKNKSLFTYHCDASNEYQVSDFFEKVKKRTKKIDAKSFNSVSNASSEITTPLPITEVTLSRSIPDGIKCSIVLTPLITRV